MGLAIRIFLRWHRSSKRSARIHRPSRIAKMVRASKRKSYQSRTRLPTFSILPDCLARSPILPPQVLPVPSARFGGIRPQTEVLKPPQIVVQRKERMEGYPGIIAAVFAAIRGDLRRQGPPSEIRPCRGRFRHGAIRPRPDVPRRDRNARDECSEFGKSMTHRQEGFERERSDRHDHRTRCSGTQLHPRPEKVHGIHGRMSEICPAASFHPMGRHHRFGASGGRWVRESRSTRTPRRNRFGDLPKWNETAPAQRTSQCGKRIVSAKSEHAQFAPAKKHGIRGRARYQCLDPTIRQFEGNRFAGTSRINAPLCRALRTSVDQDEYRTDIGRGRPEVRRQSPSRGPAPPSDEEGTPWKSDSAGSAGRRGLSAGTAYWSESLRCAIPPGNAAYV